MTTTFRSKFDNDEKKEINSKNMYVEGGRNDLVQCTTHTQKSN